MRLKTKAKPVQYRKICLVNTVHISGDGYRLHYRGIIRKYPTHQFLESGVTGSDDFMRVKPDNQLCGNKAGCYITADNVNGLFFENLPHSFTP